jgi:hypothetical protein
VVASSSSVAARPHLKNGEEDHEVADTTGARRAIEWFLGASDAEPSDTDLVDLHCFLRHLMDQIDAGTEMNLPEWEVLAAPEPERRRALN